MPAGASESAIVVRVAVPPALERLRGRWDRAAAAGVPAHVTILYPFMPPGALDAGVRRTLAEIAAADEAFEVRFARVGRFPTAVYLAPEPSEPFNRLTEAIHARFPAFPPYEGAFDEVIPHLTITESVAAPLDVIEHEAAGSLPFERRVARLELIVEGSDGWWRSRWRIPLGRRSGVD
jgi:2'-5' RNA ligase